MMELFHGREQRLDGADPSGSVAASSDGRTADEEAATAMPGTDFNPITNRRRK